MRESVQMAQAALSAQASRMVQKQSSGDRAKQLLKQVQLLEAEMARMFTQVEYTLSAELPYFSNNSGHLRALDSISLSAPPVAQYNCREAC